MTLTIDFRTALRAGLLVLAASTGGCGGGAGTAAGPTPAPAPGPDPATITGIATPPQIAVVTAKNST